MASRSVLLQSTRTLIISESGGHVARTGPYLGGIGVFLAHRLSTAGKTLRSTQQYKRVNEECGGSLHYHH